MNSTLLKKYETIDQSKVTEKDKKVLEQLKKLTNNFEETDEAKNKVAEKILNQIELLNPDAIKKPQVVAKIVAKAKKVVKAKKPATTSTAKNSGNNIMSVAKEIQKSGESWKDAMERAKEVLKQRKEQVVEKKKTEMDKLLALVRTKKELKGFANSDINRDSRRTALPRGQRISANGNKYYENRENRTDRLAPNYPKDMPLLAKGGSVNMNKNIWEGWTVGDFIEDLEPTFNQIMRGSSWQKPFKTKDEVKAWTMDNQPYYKKNIPEVVNYFWAKVQSNDNYADGGELEKYKNQGWKKTNRSTHGFDVFSKKIDESTHYVVFDKKGNFLSRSKNNPEQAEMEAYQVITKDMPLLAKGGAINDAPFSVEVFKTKLRFDNELTSSSKGDFPTFAKAKEFAIDMIDNGNYYAYINSKSGYLWGVGADGVEQFADGGNIDDSWDLKMIDSDEEGSYGKVLHNGKEVADYEFDRNARAFWVNNPKGGQMALDTREELFDFYKSKGNYANGGSTEKYKVGQKFYDTRYDRVCEIVPSKYDGVVTWKRYNKSGTEFENDSEHILVENQFDYLVNMGAYQISKQQMAKGGSVSNEKMYNFLQDDLEKLEVAINDGDNEEIERFFSYWSYHLKSLENKGYGEKYGRMYNFLKDDLEKLEVAINNNDTEEVERFFSYWGQHLKSLKMANGGSLPFMTDPNFGNFQNTGSFANGGLVVDNRTDLEEVAKYMTNAVKKHRWDLKDLIYYFEKENNFDYKYRIKIWDEMNGYEMRKTYENILEMLKRIVEANGKKFESGGSLPFMTDPNFGDFQNTSAFAYGGETDGYTLNHTVEFTTSDEDSYLSGNVGGNMMDLIDVENIGDNRYSAIAKSYSVAFEGLKGQELEDEVYNQINEMFATNDDIEVDLESVKIAGKFELGGAFMMTDLAGHTGGSDGLGNPPPLDGFSGTHYTGLVGETGAMSSGELFARGGGVGDNVLGLKKGDIYKIIDTFHTSSYDTTMSVFTFIDYEDKYGEIVLKSLPFPPNPKRKNDFIYVSDVSSDGIKVLNDEEIGQVISRKYKNFVQNNYEAGGGIEKTTKVEDMKNAMYKAFQSYLDGKISDEKLVSALNRILGKRRWFRYFEGDTGASDVRSVESALNSRVNREGEKESMQIALDTKGIQIHNWEGNEIFEAGGAMMQNQQVIDDASQSYVNYYLGEGASQGIYKDGGAIVNQYEGRTAEDVWNNLSVKQRQHFLIDHFVKVEDEEQVEYNDLDEEQKEFVDEYSKYTWKNLDWIKIPFKKHVKMGQYAYGGKTKGGKSMKELYIEQIASLTGTRTVGVEKFVDDNNLTDSELSNLMTGLGRGMVKRSDFVTALSGEKGNAMQKEVIAFAKSDKAYKMADGGAINGMLNKKIQKLADVRGFEIGDWATSEYNKIMTQALVESLTDANFHDEAKQVVVKAERKTKWSDDLYKSEYFNPDEKVASFAREVAKESDYDGDDIINTYFFITKMAGSKVGTMIEDLFLKAKPTKSDFVGTVEFNVGDIVWDKGNKRYGTVMNNYGDPINGESGEIRLDSDGNQTIFTYDKNYKNTGYNLVKLGEKGDMGKFTPDVLADTKARAKGMIDNSKASKYLKPNVPYYQSVYKRLLDGEFDSMAKGTAKPKKYIDHDDIKIVTVKYKGKEVSFKGEDVLNGANLMEKGGDLSKIAFYIAKRDVISVELKNGETIKPVNEYWIKKGAEPLSSPSGTPKSKTDENKAHFQADALGNVFVDSNFVNQSQGNLPNTELKHYGFGDFYLQTPDGNIDFIRTSEEKEGFVGRTHKMKGSDELVLKLVNAMKEKGRFESTQMFKRGGRVSVNYAGNKSKENWGKNDLYEMYANSIDLDADLVDYFKDYEKHFGKEEADREKKELMETLKSGKMNFNYGASLTFADGGFMSDVYAKGGEVSDIQKMKKALISKAKSRGLYENFGEKEVRVLEDKYGYTDNVRDFNNWAMNFDLSKMANGGMFDDNEGFMRADNENNYRFLEREVNIDTIDEPIDLTDNVSNRSNEVVIRPLDEDIDLNEDGRVRARMGFNPMNRNPNKMMGVNQRMVITDLPMPQSNTHKND